ncbi:MAG: glycosyltransferase [Candidatus Sulfotelmatobacter sp.]
MASRRNQMFVGSVRVTNCRSLLYIGTNSGTSRHRALALGRLGYDVFIIDPAAFLPHSRFVSAWTWHTGGLFVEHFVRRKVLENIPSNNFDLVYVDGGELAGPSLILELKNRFGSVINYNLDDPYGRRDGRRWKLYLRSVPFYDLVVVVRDSNVPEAIARGARNVLRAHRSADEIAHAPRQISRQDWQKWGSEIVFVGTWMPERGHFMARLIELGVPLSIYGGRWQKAREWPVLRSCWRGATLEREQDYAMAIQCAKVSLGLLSKGNRDLTTQRSFEIPHLGGVLCAERTPEHSELYREDEEAVFWSSPEECAEKCMQLLQDEPRRKRLAMNGRRRCLHNGTTNQKVLAQVLQQALLPDDAHSSFANVKSSAEAAGSYDSKHLLRSDEPRLSRHPCE